MSLFAIVAIVVVVVVIVVALVATAFIDDDKTSNPSSEKTESKSPDQMTDKEKEQYEKEKQDREWSDPNEHAKYVCHGGKIQCQYCSSPISDIIVTSNTIMLQDKPWATVQDKNGLVNFNFIGQCLHPSQQKPLVPPPPCKAVINLGEWKDFSETIIDRYNALVVQATIPCMISGEDLNIIDSGQKAELSQVEPKQKRIPKIIQSYWIDEDGNKIERITPNKDATLIVETKDYTPQDVIEVKLPIDGIIKVFKGSVNTKGIATFKKIYRYSDNNIKQPRIIEAYWQNELGEQIEEILVDDKAILFVRTEGYKKDSIVKITIKRKDKRLFTFGMREIMLSGKVNSEGIAMIKNTKWL